MTLSRVAPDQTDFLDGPKEDPKTRAKKDRLAFGIGIVLLAIFLAVKPPAAFGLVHVIGGVLGFLLVTNFVVKKSFPFTKNWFVFSVWETTRFNPWFDWLKNARWVEIASEIGAVLGFGAVAIDFLWGRQLKNRTHRVILFIVSVLVLGTLFGIATGSNLQNAPLVKGPFFLYQLFFGVFGLSGFMLFGLLMQGLDGVFKIMEGKKACPGVAPVIPGVQTPNLPLFVPIEAWISLLAILIIHEASHGFLARRHNLKVLGSGLLLAGILPIGAFVKPDEKKMKQMPARKQVQIVAAGPASNLYSFFIVGLLLTATLQFVVQPTIGQQFRDMERQSTLGVEIAKVDQNISFCGETFESPAFGKIQEKSRILKIDDKNVLTASEVTQALRTNPNEPKKLLLEKDGEITETTLTPGVFGRIGIQIGVIPNPNYEPPANWVLIRKIVELVVSIIGWFVQLSLFVAIANFLPIDPIDGGRIAKLMVTPYFGFLQMSPEDTERFVGRLFLWMLLPLLVLNALPLFF